MRHDERMPVTRADVDAAIRDLGLGGRAVCVHSSLRSFGTLEGGPDTLIDAFLDAGSTLLVPSHSWGFASNHQAGMRPARNGWDYSMNVAPPAFPGRLISCSPRPDRVRLYDFAARLI